MMFPDFREAYDTILQLEAEAHYSAERTSAYIATFWNAIESRRVSLLSASAKEIRLGDIYSTRTVHTVE